VSLFTLQVDRVISEADGYQPHLVAPEMGYRRLLQECLILFKVQHVIPKRVVNLLLAV
jgi:hypothetical protein